MHAMQLSDLNDDEALVLVGFMRVVIQADGEYSDDERKHVAIVETALGSERFQHAMSQVGELDALKALAKRVARREAQHAIFDVLSKIAGSDGLTSEEEKPLRWLASWWKV